MSEVPRAKAEVEKLAEEASKTEDLERFLVDSLTEYAVFAVSTDGFIISWNVGAETNFGYLKTEVIGRHFRLIFTPEDIASGAPEDELASALSGRASDHDRWHVRKDGTRFWGINTVQPIFDSDQLLLGFTKLVRDTTAAHVASEALGDSEERLRLLVESVHDYAIFSTALDGTITSWNIGAEHIFGYAHSEIIGQNHDVLFCADDIAAGVPAAELLTAEHDGFCNEERMCVRKNKTRFLAACKLTQLKRGIDGQLRGFVKVVHDITERARFAEDLRQRAFHDQLTKLPNRAFFHDQVQRAIGLLKRRSALFAVLFIDLDHFKRVNDTFGHSFADQLLEFTARRLEQCMRSEDVVARLGGDEFAILLSPIAGLHDAEEAAQRIIVVMAQPLMIDGHELKVSASVGIVLGASNHNSCQQVLRDADAAMYEAKGLGRARWAVFDQAMKARENSNQNLEADLRGAIARRELRVEYQPVLSLRDKTIVGFEALVRWQHPRRGLLAPIEFIPRAEESDLIIAIDRWVLREACAQLKVWQGQFAMTVPLQMSVNFSSKQFSHSELSGVIRDVLWETGIAAGSLRLEITESAVMERSERTSALLADIRSLGVELHIDDFGTGYSSLVALQHLPVNALKIDAAFVASIQSQSGAELVRTITSLAHNLGLSAIAEGVETEEQRQCLEAFGCEYAQGFLFSKPLSASAASVFLMDAGFVAA